MSDDTTSTPFLWTEEILKDVANWDTSIGQNYNKNDDEGYTPLCFTTLNGLPADIVIKLVNNGAIATKICNKGKSPIQSACISGNAEAVRVLLGGAIDETDNDGNVTYALDEAGNKIPKTDIYGNVIYALDAAGNKIPLRDKDDNIVYETDQETCVKTPINANEYIPNDLGESIVHQYMKGNGTKKVFNVPPLSVDYNIVYKYDDEDRKEHSPMRDADGNPIKQCDKNGNEIHKKDDNGKEIKNKFEYIWDYEYLPKYVPEYKPKNSDFKIQSGKQVNTPTLSDIYEAAKLKTEDVLVVLLDKKYPSGNVHNWANNKKCSPLYYATSAQCYGSINAIIDKTNTTKISLAITCNNPYYENPDDSPIEGFEGESSYQLAINNEDVGALEIFNKYVDVEYLALIPIVGIDGGDSLFTRLLSDLYDCSSIYFDENDNGLSDTITHPINKMYYELYNNTYDNGNIPSQRNVFLNKFCNSTDSFTTRFITYVVNTYSNYNNDITTTGYTAKRRVAPFIDVRCYDTIKSLYDANKLDGTDKNKVSTKAAKRNDLDIMELVDKPSTNRWEIWPTYNDLIDDKYYTAINHAYENNKPSDTLDYTKVVQLINSNASDATSETGLCIGILSNSAVIKNTELSPFKKIIDRFYPNTEFNNAYSTLYEDVSWNTSAYQDKLNYILSKARNDDSFASHVNSIYNVNRFLSGFISKKCYKIINILYDNDSLGDNINAIKDKAKYPHPSSGDYLVPTNFENRWGLWPDVVNLADYYVYEDIIYCYDNDRMNSSDISLIKSRTKYPHTGSHGTGYLEPQSLRTRWDLWPSVVNLVDNCQSSSTALSDLIYRHNNNGITSQSDKNYITTAVNNYIWNQDPDHQSDPLYPKSPAINPDSLTGWPWW